MRLRSIRLVAAWCSALTLVFVAACQTAPVTGWQRGQWLRVHERSGTSLRGLSVVDRSTLWASGTGGMVLRSTDGGGTWSDVGPLGAESFDLRDVHGFDADTALAMVAGQPARVYRTEDGGTSWRVVYEDEDSAAFFDGMAFAGERGYLFGDPTDGAFYVLRSEDSGRSWQRVAPGSLPRPAAAEAGFAAGGSCVRAADGSVWIGTGGERARCLRSDDQGLSWNAVDLPMLEGLPSQGAFGVAFRGRYGVAVGGDYRAPERSSGTSAWTTDGGRTWRRAGDGAGGYRSAAVWLDDRHVIAVGEGGCSLSKDGGRSWETFGDRGFHAVERAADGAVFACGSDGRIALLLQPEVPEFGLMALFGDHMVLPPIERVVLRGTGAPKTLVDIETSWGAAATARIAKDGSWRCPIDTPERGGPFTVSLQCGDERIELRDVLIGDVWLASGQSNMEMPIGNTGGWRGGVLDSKAEIAAANHPQLRVFTVTRATSGEPLGDFEGEWKVCSPETAAGFSAVAYFFARELQARGKGPIGMVVSSWGGTVCEAWTRGEALVGFPEFADALARTKGTGVARSELVGRFWNALPAQPGDAWEDVHVPGSWSATGLADFDGVAFYRRTIDVPTPMRGKTFTLELGAIDDMDTVWCNGTRIGGTEDVGAWSVARRYAVPGAVTAGRATIEVLVRVVDTGGEGGLTGEDGAVRLFAQEPKYEIPLAGTWQRQRSVALADLPEFPVGVSNSPNRPAVLYNAMIAPLVPFPFTGAIWYQGESNRKRPDQYARLFPAMIRDWRLLIGRDFPFHFVQIAPFAYGRDTDDDTAGLRLAQAAALSLPHTGMAVTLDIGNARDIHPRNKQDVGRRLALQALRDPYGMDVVADGPSPAKVERDGSAVRITFVGTEGGLLAEAPVTGFEVAGLDGGFVAAQARIDGDTVVLSAASVAEPMLVRYAWASVPVVTLRNGEGLPAAPFVDDSLRKRSR